MNKCDWCPNSRLVNGKLVCPYSICMLPKSEIKNILKELKRK